MGEEQGAALRAPAARVGNGDGRARRNRRGASIAAFVHRWIGLTLGLILAMSGLTGSYLAFYPEIERAALAPLRQSADARPESYEAAYRTFSRIAVSATGSWNIELPERGGVITGRYGQRGEPLRMVSIDPRSLAVVRDVRWGGTFSTWLYELHQKLLLEGTGKTLMGVVALLLTVMLGAGMLLWWRSGRSMASRLRFERRGSAERKIYDVHRLVGLGSAVLLLGMMLTAAAMNLPRQVRPLLAGVSPITPAPKVRSTPAAGRLRLPVDRAISIAEARFAGASARWVQVPGAADGAYQVRVWQPGEPSRRFPRTTVWIDRYDGRVLAVRDGPAGTASDRILDWLYPLHSGQAFGAIGRGIVAALGLVPALLLVTGFIRWRGKARRNAAYRRASHIRNIR